MSQSEKEIYELSQRRYGNKSGYELMKLADVSIISAGLAKFRSCGFIEKYEINQVLCSVYRLIKLAGITKNEENELLISELNIIKEDLESYCHDIYDNCYFSIAKPLDEFYMNRLNKIISEGYKFFSISESCSALSLAEKLYDILEKELNSENAADEKLISAMGGLFGKAVCDGYGWHWELVGEPIVRPDNKGYWLDEVSFAIISPDEMFCIIPKEFVNNLFGSYSETRDNTLLLFYNMLADIEKQTEKINPGKIKYCLIG